ncbi:RimJ/RimL family protein N-acetyltransferase [Litoreibacter ponti]|uniref:RimJ/RimL family protein N-acetyltransferase n=1 Tax=Litoreibacter ponti TaxID=1510457 RepID=A0A2T6BED5_9RHOB|nr:GNAT family N-acetyltransferase [Litoreibacter ponti]PTX54423.1 RimJ/RimL family protein N-acetyltransferase [Litoreibacter ponti]
MTPPTLHTERLTLRAPTMDDWPAYKAFYASDATRFTGGPYDAKQSWTLFAGDLGHWGLMGFGWFILDDGTGAVGACGLHHPPHQADPEIGWNTFPTAQGKGYATEAARTVLDWGWTTLKPARIVSYIDRGNMASKAVAAKLGATFAGDMAAHDPACETWVHSQAEAA